MYRSLTDPHDMRDAAAIVTGGSSGIGRATCLALARRGAAVAVVGTNAGRVTDTVREVASVAAHSKPLGLVLDVRNERDMEQMAAATLQRFGRIDILVASAGIGRRRESTRMMPYAVAQLPIAEWAAIVDTNLRGTFLSNRAVLSTMISQQRGTIVNISSSPGGFNGEPFAAAYCASKFAVVGLSSALAAEVSDHGVRVHVIYPDAIDTPLLHSSTLAMRRGPPIDPDTVGDLIVRMIEGPEGALHHPVVAPFRTWRRSAGDRRP